MCLRRRENGDRSSVKHLRMRYRHWKVCDMDPSAADLQTHSTTMMQLKLFSKLNRFYLHHLVLPAPPADCSLISVRIYANKKTVSIISFSSWQEHKQRARLSAARTGRCKDVGLTHHPASWAATLAGAAPRAGIRPKPAQLPAAPGRGRAFFPPSPHPLSAPGRKEGQINQRLQRPTHISAKEEQRSASDLPSHPFEE